MEGQIRHTGLVFATCGLEEDLCVCTTLLASGLEEEVREWDNKLETLAYYFVRLGECRLKSKC